MAIRIISGGALGSDSVWGLIAEQAGIPKSNIIHYIANGMVRPRGNADRQAEQQSGVNQGISTDEMNNAIQSMIDMDLTISGKPARQFFTRSGWSYTASQKLHARNYYQVINGDQVLAVVPITNGDVSGGTATAVHLAIKLGKPVYVLNTVDCEWYKYQDGSYIKCDVPKLMDKNTCIGTRTLVQYNVCKYGQWVPAPYVGEQMEQALRAQMAKVFA